MPRFTHSAQSFSGHLALPESGQHPGVLLFHAWWGLNEFFLRTCERLTTEGFVVLAPDLFNGSVARTIDEAQKLRSQVDRKFVKKQVRAALDFLAAHEAVTGEYLGTVGFSYGASYALECARLRPKLVNSVTLFYGTGGGKLDKTNALFQGHFAENDEWGANPKKVDKLKERIEGAGQGAQFYIYPSTTHWFFEDDQYAYDEEAAELAWQRTVDFMKERLSVD